MRRATNILKEHFVPNKISGMGGRGSAEKRRKQTSPCHLNSATQLNMGWLSCLRKPETGLTFSHSATHSAFRIRQKVALKLSSRWC